MNILEEKYQEYSKKQQLNPYSYYPKAELDYLYKWLLVERQVHKVAKGESGILMTLMPFLYWTGLFSIKACKNVSHAFEISAKTPLDIVKQRLQNERL